MSTPSVAPYDVVVVGARPAGAATALVLARAGLRILVVDRGKYGADTVSTHASSAVRCCSSLYAPRRTVLDAILVDAARDVGAEVRFGVAVTDLRRVGNGRSPRSPPASSPPTATRPVSSPAP
ncbi:MAG: FAD-dependent monooxygenase, partial [Micromonosporaceae bacterium]